MLINFELIDQDDNVFKMCESTDGNQLLLLAITRDIGCASAPNNA